MLQSRLGTYLMAAGAVGEFGPILLLTLVLSTRGSAHNGLILGAFVLIALAVAWFALGSSRRSHPLLERTLHSSSQLAVRWALVLVFGLAFLAYRLGLDLLLGGFASGLIAGELLRRRPLPEFESKLTAVGFGFFVPFFFVVSGMGLDISAFGTVSGILRTLMFLALMCCWLVGFRRWCSIDARWKHASAVRWGSCHPHSCRWYWLSRSWRWRGGLCDRR